MTVRTLFLLLAVITSIRAVPRVAVASQQDRNAARELTYYIAKATGNLLPIVVKAAEGESESWLD